MVSVTSYDDERGFYPRPGLQEPRQNREQQLNGFCQLLLNIFSFAMGILMCYTFLNVTGKIAAPTHDCPTISTATVTPDIRGCPQIEGEVQIIIFGPGAASTNQTDHQRLTVQDQMPSDHVIPEEYDLNLKVFLPGYGTVIPKGRELTFDGTVAIKLMAIKETTFIELNSHKDIIISSAILSDKSGKSDVPTVPAIIKMEMMKRKEKIAFHLSQALQAGNEVILTITYSAPISSGLSGLYQTKYNNSRGEQRIAAVTQMESNHAREMVPCFDQPVFKAKWTVTVTHPKGTTAVANGIELGKPSEENDNFLVSRFATTPKMSSYLLAVVVSDFVYREGRTPNGVRFRIWSRPEAYEFTKYALDIGIKCLHFFEDHFGIKYPLEKQDMFAIPDFDAGAMENWGLITYRETALLYNEKTYSTDGRQRVATVVAHELAHQWFGNLVTMKFWDDIWLNEGFARLLEHIGADNATNNAMKMNDQFLKTQSRAFDLDSYSWSHPLSMNLTYFDEIDEVFDSIAYAKGASIMYMVRHLIGEKAFVKGLKNYMHKHEYNNTIHTDLLDALTDATPSSVRGPRGVINITDFALPYIRQMGHPVVTLKYLNTTHAVLSQDHYMMNPWKAIDERFRDPEFQFKWDVPLFFQQGKYHENIQMFWLSREKEEVVVKFAMKPIILNAESYSYFTMNYEVEEWNAIFQQLEDNHNIYSPRTRYALIRSAFAMFWVHKVPAESLGRLFNYIRKETNFLPLQLFVSEFSGILSRVANTELYKPGADLLISLLHSHASKIDVDFIASNYKNDQHFTGISGQAYIYAKYCKLNPSACRDKLEHVYKASTKKCGSGSMSSSCSDVPAPLRPIVYCYLSQNDNAADFEKIIEFIGREQDSKEVDNLAAAFGCVNDEKNILNILELANSGYFREQAVGPRVYGFLSTNPMAGAVIPKFVMNNWQTIEKKFLPSTISDIAAYGLGSINDKQQLEELKELAESSQSSKLKKQIGKIEFRLEFLDKHWNSIKALFAQAA